MFRPYQVVSAFSVQEVDAFHDFRKNASLTAFARIFGVRGPLFLPIIWTMITITVIWTVTFFFANMLQCYPISENWTGLGGTTDTCINENMMYVGQAFSDAITDLIILVMPIPCVSFPAHSLHIQADCHEDLGTSAASETKSRREWHVFTRNTVSFFSHATRVPMHAYTAKDHCGERYQAGNFL